jgi:hypothetical protein
MAGYIRSDITGVRISAGGSTSLTFTLEERYGQTPRGSPREDSLALLGTWRWVNSRGGLLGANATPPATGWWRLLRFKSDGSYSFTEYDSLGSYLLCEGKSVIHPCRAFIEDGPSASLCIELERWWVEMDRRLLVSFIGRDTIMTYPGGSGFGVADALRHIYVRDEMLSAPSLEAERGKERPPRLSNALPGTYRVDLPSEGWKLLRSFGPFYQWMDWQYPESVRRSHRYAHDETPSAVIADFDGDGAADVAIHGTSEGYKESKVICLLTNRGNRRVVLLLSEPTDFATQDTTRFREPHPTLFLRLLHAGEQDRDMGGKMVSFPTNIILIARPGGYAVPYYLEGEAFVKGPRVESLRWTPRDPR